MRGCVRTAVSYRRCSLCLRRCPAALAHRRLGSPLLYVGCRPVSRRWRGSLIPGTAGGTFRAAHGIRSRSSCTCTSRRRSCFTGTVSAVRAHCFTCAVCTGSFRIAATGRPYIAAIGRRRRCPAGCSWRTPVISCPGSNSPLIGFPARGAYCCRIGYACGARRSPAVAIYFRPVKAYRTVVYRCFSGARRAANFTHRHPAACSPFNLAPARTAYVRTVVVYVRVVDDRGAVIYPHLVAVRRIVTIQPWAGDIPLRHKHPVMVGNADMYVDAHARTQRCPAVVTAAAPPAYPSRPPLVTRYPGPTVIVGIRPAAIMEWRPSPSIVRYPGVPVVGHHPMAISGVGLEALFRVRKPYISIFRIVDPLSVRC